ncbi:hypothetical protein DER45DRAFT_596400 [Fusarium avenaceum]|nr:hypothetical protein DER45DRAFT_596400 [Fusarium avenaceum]
MASSTFHPFSRLPTEVRLKIWEAACFPFQQHHKGLHYVELFDVDDYHTKMRQIKHKNQDQDSDHSSHSANPSAYIWDVGLWTACKESREVVHLHLKIDDPIKVRIDIQEDSSQPVSRVNDGNDVQFGYLYSHDSSQDHKLVDWCSLGVSNVAFEFDLSWNSNLPHCLNDMIEENSPRGMLAKALYHAVDGYRSPQLWIIDNKTPWLRSPDQDIHTVYYDCEDAYVEIDWEDTRIDTRRQAHQGLATRFMERLSYLGQDDYNSYRFRGELSPWENCVYYSNATEFFVEDAVKLLVRRDNEVKQFTDEGH